ncbi:MAG: Bax inhibitor-1/YccA family protein [Alloprevotella sp.]|nr:Bax inhibitor-1/YccA family protein [Alloprevotella sp.]
MDFEEKYLQERPIEMDLTYAKLMRNVYLWMTLGLAITAGAAYFVAGRPDWVAVLGTNPVLLFGMMIAEVGLVILLSMRINKMSFKTASLMFALYSLVNGVTLSFVLLSYTRESIVTTFLVTAGTFGVMSCVGYFTKRDLSTLGRILYMLLIGTIIASLVNLFFHNSTFELILSIIGVVMFTGLTAYDTQKIKQNLIDSDSYDNETVLKIALMGALQLYLDFINLFLYLLRFLGKNR